MVIEACVRGQLDYTLNNANLVTLDGKPLMQVQALRDLIECQFGCSRQARVLFSGESGTATIVAPPCY